MGLVTYIGPEPEVFIVAANESAEKGVPLEVTDEIAEALLTDPGEWEPADEATAALTPGFPTPPTMATGVADPFDAGTVYPTGMISEEDGALYRSTKPSRGETPSLAPRCWERISALTQPGIPGLLLPIASIGSVIGLSAFNVAIGEELLATFSRAIVPKTGKLADFAIREDATGEPRKTRVAVYDTGQKTEGVYTLLGKSAAEPALTEGEEESGGGWHEFGDLGAPKLIAGQHVMLACATDAWGPLATGTFSGGIPLPAGWLPGRVRGKLVAKAMLASLDFPASFTEAELIPREQGIHALARIA